MGEGEAASRGLCEAREEEAQTAADHLIFSQDPEVMKLLDERVTATSCEKPSQFRDATAAAIDYFGHRVLVLNFGSRQP